MKPIVQAMLVVVSAFLLVGCQSDVPTAPTGQSSAIGDEGILALGKPTPNTERPTISFSGDEMTITWSRVLGAKYYKVQWYQYTGDPQAPVMLYTSPFSDPIKGTSLVVKNGVLITPPHGYLARVDAYDNKDVVMITRFSLYFFYL